MINVPLCPSVIILKDVKDGNHQSRESHGQTVKVARNINGQHDYQSIRNNNTDFWQRARFSK